MAAGYLAREFTIFDAVDLPGETYPAFSNLHT
jgi:hypothetical protein